MKKDICKVANNVYSLHKCACGKKIPNEKKVCEKCMNAALKAYKELKERC